MSVKFTPAAKAMLAGAFLVPILAASAAPTGSKNASGTLYGGGATLPQIAYAGTSWITTNGTTALPTPLRLTDPTDMDSLFGGFTAAVPAKSSGETAFPAVSYCAIGSGGGRKVFYGLSGFVASQACGDYGSSNKNGFSAPGSEPNFAASDAPLSDDEVSNKFHTAKAATHTEPVQIPAIAGALAVVYNNSDVPTTPLLNLTESQLCQIFAGDISNWSQLGFPAKPIKIVYRSDDSGTSFNFSNHLSAVCPTAVPTGETVFSTQSTISKMFSTLPATWTNASGANAQNGNGAVTTEVNSLDGAIGYAEVADAVLRSTLAGSKIRYTTISAAPDVVGSSTQFGHTYKKWDPTSLGNRYTLPTGTVVADQVITGDDSNGRPVLGSPTLAPKQAGCFFVADPNKIATAPTVAYVKTPTSASDKRPAVTFNDYKAYPIVAVTYLLAYNTGNGADAYNIGNLLAAPYSGTGSNNYRGVTTVGNNTTTGSVSTGYAYLAGVPAGFATTIKNCVLN